MINVHLKFFGPLRDIVDTDDLTIAVPDHCTGERAFDMLTALHPGLREWKPSVRLAVNLEYRRLSHALGDDDEVCFIPPVSGG